MWQRGLIGRTASARVPSHKWSAFTSRGEQLESVSSTPQCGYLQLAFTSRRERLGSVNSTRERSVDICSWLLPLDEKLYLAPSQKYTGETAPNASTITLLVHLVQQFRDPGSIADRKRSGRASIGKTKVADVKTVLERSLMKRHSVYINIITESISLLNSEERYA
ncbi:DUF4817 domain-containing protein [Trichonephila clavipes]|nr:DUF4817 domain-containing protein [Trichonephila clavipes]